uniref:Poly [ADP-ribose] polymerase 10-like n=1 Tax=Saccoglossus kowalevskii TaxID=10224 RepID=A0ABM0M6T6_SACKO
IVDVLDDETNCTIEVTGCDPGTNPETIELYFDNKRRSGGGDVSECRQEGDKFFVTFENEDAVGRVLEQPIHVVKNTTLLVKRAAKTDIKTVENVEEIVDVLDDETNCTIEVTGCDPGTSPETIELYFDNKRRSGGGDVSECRQEGDKFFVTFENEDAVGRVLEQPTHVVKNTTLLVKRAAKTDINTVENVEEIVDVLDDETNCTIEVTGCDPGTIPETIELYFDNKRRSGGGDVSECRQEGDKFFVTFENEDAVRRVLEQPTHVVKNTTLLVKRAAKTDINTVENVE